MADSESRLIRAWLGAVAGLLALFAVVFVARGLAGGHGAVYRNGEFILIDGRSVREVSQRLGLVYYAIEKAFTVLLVGSMILTFLVWCKTGSLDIRRHLDSLGRSRASLKSCLEIALVLLAVAFVANMIFLFGLT